MLIRTLAITAALALAATAAQAQDYTQQPDSAGPLTLHSGSINGQSFTGTDDRVGNWSYGSYTFQNGRTLQCSTNTMGGNAYTNCY